MANPNPMRGGAQWSGKPVDPNKSRPRTELTVPSGGAGPGEHVCPLTVAVDVGFIALLRPRARSPHCGAPHGCIASSCSIAPVRPSPLAPGKSRWPSGRSSWNVHRRRPSRRCRHASDHARSWHGDCL